jgi:hypothetical protein
MAMSWEQNDSAYYATISVGQERELVKFRLIVEPLPDHTGWDWAIWRSDRPHTPRHGKTPCARTAMMEAEFYLSFSH